MRSLGVGLTRPRILVNDDDPGALQGMALLFEAAGCVVDQTSSFEDAMRLMARLHHDLVVTDLTTMPGFSPSELIRSMRRVSRFAPILVVTGAEDVTEALDGGADELLHKPIALSELLNAGEEILRQRRHHIFSAFTLGPIRLDREPAPL